MTASIHQTPSPRPPSSSQAKEIENQAYAPPKKQQVASQILNRNKKESYFDAFKNFSAEVEEELKKLKPRTVALRDPFWIFKMLGKAYESYGVPPAESSLQATKEAIQKAIQQAKIQNLFELLKNPEAKPLIHQPLPNGQLPLNYAILNGNINAVKLLLQEGCNPEQCDFQSQSSFDIAHVLGNEETTKYLTDFLIGHFRQKRLQLYLQAHKKDSLDEKKIKTDLEEMEKIIRKRLDEKLIIDPLSISKDELISCIAGLILLAVESTDLSALLGDWSSSVQGLAAIALVLGNMSEMRYVFQNYGRFQYPLHILFTLSQLIPSVRYIYNSMKTSIVTLSLLQTLGVCSNNLRYRPWDTTKKLAADSFNFYNFISNTFNFTISPQNKQMSKEDCKDLQRILIKFHPDKITEELQQTLKNDDLKFNVLNELYQQNCRS